MGSQDQISEIGMDYQEGCDEFLRNFFIKFGMKRTLDSFQQEWFELKTKGDLDETKMPDIPQVYKENLELANVLTALQKEVDEARIIAEKSRSTYDKLRKQRDYQKINHRRVQQEKGRLKSDLGKLESQKDVFEEKYKYIEAKYTAAVKEKMLMKLDKDRLWAKVDSLEANLDQVRGEEKDDQKLQTGDISQQLQGSPGKTQYSQISGKKAGSPQGKVSTANMKAG